MHNQERQAFECLGSSNQGLYLWQYASTHQHRASNKIRTCECDTCAHNSPLAEAHQVDLLRSSVIGRHRFPKKRDHRLPAGLGLSRVNDRPLRREIDIKPGIASRPNCIWGTHTDDQKTLVQVWRQTKQVILVAANAVEQQQERRITYFDYLLAHQVHKRELLPTPTSLYHLYLLCHLYLLYLPGEIGLASTRHSNIHPPRVY